MQIFVLLMMNKVLKIVNNASGYAKADVKQRKQLVAVFYNFL